MVHGDSIITYEYTKDSKKIIDEFYKNNKSMADLFKEFVAKKTTSRKVDISVKIVKDPQMAEVLRNKVLDYFKEVSK